MRRQAGGAAMTLGSRPIQPGKPGARPSRDRRFVSLNPVVESAELQRTTTGRHIGTITPHWRAELSTMSAPMLTIGAVNVSIRLCGRSRRFRLSPYNYYRSF